VNRAASSEPPVASPPRCKNEHLRLPSDHGRRSDIHLESDVRRSNAPGSREHRRHTEPMRTTRCPTCVGSCRDGHCAPGVISWCRLGEPHIPGVAGELATFQRPNDCVTVADLALALAELGESKALPSIHGVPTRCRTAPPRGNLRFTCYRASTASRGPICQLPPIVGSLTRSHSRSNDRSRKN
jgi:hypothetical protein